MANSTNKISTKEIEKRNRIAMESLAMDLKRVALGYHRGAIVVAKRFSEEALKREQEIDKSKVKPYIRKILQEIEHILHGKDEQKIAEDALMISTILQNYSQKSY